MAQQLINNGDTGLAARTKINANDSELYARDNVSQAEVTANTAKISYTDAAAVAANTTHRSSDGKNHSDVVANNAKVSNVSTNLSEGASTETTVDVNSSDGTNATLVSASASRAGLLTKAKFDEIVANNAKISYTDASDVSNNTAFRTTPSTVITAGTNLSWAGNILNATGAGGASTALDNLASVAINESLISDTDNTDALGSALIGWSALFLGNGSVITWSAAPSTPDVTLTHSSNTLTFAGGDVVFNSGLSIDAGLAYTFANGSKYGDGDSGQYESADDILTTRIAGSDRFAFEGAAFRGINGGAGMLINESASATNPTICPQHAGSH